MRSDRLRLQDALDQIELIQRFAAAGRDSFFVDELVQSGILHRLALLGEACRGLTPALREQHPEIGWRQIIGLRNIVMHEYFGVDLDLVWQVVTDHLPQLDASLRAILGTFE